MTIEEANRERDRRVEPLQEDEARLQKRLAQLEAEIQRFVTALGQGQVSVGRLENEIRARQATQGPWRPSWAVSASASPRRQPPA
jgi:SMC interacting uncharacterized protein involved in chromosome segregation